MKPALRRRLVLAAKLAFGAALLIWLLTSGRLDLASLGRVPRPGLLVAAAATLAAGLTLQALRWRLLLILQDRAVSWMLVVRLYWLGQFASLFLPGAAGGDLARGYALCRHLPDARTRAVSTVIVDRLVGLHTLISISAASAVSMSLRGSSVAPGVLGLAGLAWAGLTAALLWLLVRPGTERWLALLPGRLRDPLAQALGLYRRRPGLLVRAWWVSVVCSLLAVAAYLLVASALELGAGLEQLLAVPWIILASSVPITPGGLGVGEAAGSELYRGLGIEQGAAVVLFVRLLLAAVSLPGAAMLMSRFEPESFEPGDSPCPSQTASS